MSAFKDNKKDLAILFSVLTVLIIAVCGDGFADMAKHKFWWSFWAVVQVLCIVLALGFWIWAWTSQDKGTKPK